MKIPENPPMKGQNKIENKGDVSRDLIEASNLTSVIIVPARLVEANKKNGIARIHTAPKKDSHKGFFDKVRAKQLPSAGDVHLVAIGTFRQALRKSGHAGPKHHPKTGH